MQYMLLICDEERRWAEMSPAEEGKVLLEYREFTEGIVKSGHYRAGSRLAPIATARTVRLRSGRPVATDGPFAETREQLGGYYLVECEDLDEAIAIASRVPSIRVGGSIEVRPVRSAPRV